MLWQNRHINYHYGKSNHIKSSNISFTKLSNLLFMSLFPKASVMPFGSSEVTRRQSRSPLTMFYGLCYIDCLRIEILMISFVTNNLTSCISHE